MDITLYSLVFLPPALGLPRAVRASLCCAPPVPSVRLEGAKFTTNITSIAGSKSHDLGRKIQQCNPCTREDTKGPRLVIERDCHVMPSPFLCRAVFSFPHFSPGHTHQAPARTGPSCLATSEKCSADQAVLTVLETELDSSLFKLGRPILVYIETATSSANKDPKPIVCNVTYKRNCNPRSSCAPWPPVRPNGYATSSRIHYPWAGDLAARPPSIPPGVLF